MGRAVKIEELGSDNGFEHIKWLFEAFRILPTRESAFPEAVYYNGNTTICIFADGTKVLSRPMEGDTFDKSTGVAMCIAKYVCRSRSRFQALVDSGCDQTPVRNVIKFGVWTLTIYPDHVLVSDGYHPPISWTTQTAQDLWTALNIWVERMAKVEE